MSTPFISLPHVQPGPSISRKRQRIDESQMDFIAMHNQQQPQQQQQQQHFQASWTGQQLQRTDQNLQGQPWQDQRNVLIGPASSSSWDELEFPLLPTLTPIPLPLPLPSSTAHLSPISSHSSSDSSTVSPYSPAQQQSSQQIPVPTTTTPDHHITPSYNPSQHAITSTSLPISSHPTTSHVITATPASSTSHIGITPTPTHPASCQRTPKQQTSIIELLPIHSIPLAEEDGDSDSDPPLRSNATRKQKHRQIEQRRRDRLNSGIAHLQVLIGTNKQDKASIVNATKLFIQQQAQITTQLHAQYTSHQVELETLRKEKAQLERQIDTLRAQQEQSQQQIQQAGRMMLAYEPVDYRSAFLSSGISRVLFNMFGHFVDANDEFFADTGFTRFELSKPFMTVISITPAYELPYVLACRQAIQNNQKTDVMVVKSFYTSTGRIVSRQTVVSPTRDKSGAMNGCIMSGLPTRAEDLPHLIRLYGSQFGALNGNPSLPHLSGVITNVATPSLPPRNAPMTDETHAAQVLSKSGLPTLSHQFMGNQIINQTCTKQINDMEAAPTEHASGNGAHMTFKDTSSSHHPTPMTNSSISTSSTPYPIPTSPFPHIEDISTPILPGATQLYNHIMSPSPPSPSPPPTTTTPTSQSHVTDTSYPHPSNQSYQDIRDIFQQAATQTWNGTNTLTG